jgi:hypothetical protein
MCQGSAGAPCGHTSGGFLTFLPGFELKCLAQKECHSAFYPGYSFTLVRLLQLG